MKSKIFILTIFFSLAIAANGLAASVKLTPIDDASVYYSPGPLNWNYGDLTPLDVRVNFAGYSLATEARAYLKFYLGGSLAGISPDLITSVKLNLSVTSADGGTVRAYHASDNFSMPPFDPWFEGTGGNVAGINWLNKPATDMVLGSFQPQLSGIVDLLASGKSWLAGDLYDGYLSVCLVADWPPLPSPLSYSFASKEAGADYAPYLTVDYAGAAVPLPTTVWLLGSGLLSLLGFRRKFGKK